MLSSLVSISMPFSDFSENIYYCVNHSSDDDNWICGHDVCPLLLIQLSLEPTKISTYQFFLKPNNIIEVLRENTLYYMLSTSIPKTPNPFSQVHSNPLFVEMKFCDFGYDFFTPDTIFLCAVVVKSNPECESKPWWGLQILFWPPGL